MERKGQPETIAGSTPVVQSFADGDVALVIQDGVAVITLAAVAGEYPWGTRRAEHRLNPITVGALNQALDVVEDSEEANVVVVANEGKFWCNGMDLKYMDAHSDAEQTQHTARMNELLVRLTCFPIPTVAALGGHWCASGGMLGLTFDYRVMADDRGYFFIPAVDLGLVFAPVQIEIMKAKLPQSMHREVMVFNTRRWVAKELVDRGLVDTGVPAAEVLPKAKALAAMLRDKGRGPARSAMGGIKRALYREVLEALSEGEDMQYDGRTKGVESLAPPMHFLSTLNVRKMSTTLAAPLTAPPLAKIGQIMDCLPSCWPKLRWSWAGITSK